MLSFWWHGKSKRGILSKRKRGTMEEACAKKILEEEEMLFSESERVRWPICQFYRNLFIGVIRTFVLNGIFQSLWFSAAFVIFFAHDSYRMPYKHPYLNQLQRLTSVCLFFLNLCSVPASFSSIGNIMAVLNMNTCLTVLRKIEIVLFVIVPIEVVSDSL